MQEFVSYTISGIMSLFAALIGVAYPLILQATQRIDDKYHSTALTQYVIDKTSFKLFRILMVVAIPVAIISPFLLFHFVSRPYICYGILCLQSILTCAQLLNFYYINHIIQKATIPSQFLDMLVAENNDNKNINEIFAFSKLYVIDTTPELLFRAVGIVYSYLRNAETEVVNSPQYNQILHSISKLLEESDPKRQTLYCKSSDLWDVLLSPRTKLGSDMRYTWIWKFIQSSIFANNTDHIIRYWSWADQYVNPSASQFEDTEDSVESSDNFKHFNTMVLAALIHGNNWKLLNELFYFSHIYPPKYDLLLNTFSDVIKELRFICSREMSWLFRYTMRGMTGGVTLDSEVQKQALRYLALSYLRLQSVNDYNITYSDPLSMPTFSKNISVCQNDIENAERLLRNVQEWQQMPDVVNNCLIPKYDYSSNANTLLLQYIEALNKHIDYLYKHPDVSEEKVQQFISELKDTIKSDQLNIPETTAKPSDLVLVDKRTRYEKIFIVKKSYLASGNEWLYFYPEGMVKQINNDVRWSYYSLCFMLKSPLKSYSIGYHQVIKALERIGVNDRHEVWVSGDLISRYKNIDDADASKLKEEGDNTWNLNGCEIHQFECKMNVVIIVKRGGIPVVYAKQFELLQDREMEELDPQSHFYSNINSVVAMNHEDGEENYKINLGRIVEFYAPKDFEYIRLNMTYPESNPSELDKIEAIDKIL